ncbi:hypothetical protein BC940DRAFT_242193 [Gongronella butleri]|nr:hypothetical protein BC940DRAFT_242193 [Gongronella butleri]
MYNGIGLSTPRGSGTNGYVVRNLSHIQARPQKRDERPIDQSQPAARKPNKEITAHDLKRKVEVECMKLQLKLEEKGLAQDEIDTKVDEFRQQKLKNIDFAQPRDAKSLKVHETHLLKEAKSKENEKVARAFRIDRQYEEGQAFNQELQQQKKEQRIRDREARQEEHERQKRRRERDHSDDDYDKEKQRRRRRHRDD